LSLVAAGCGAEGSSWSPRYQLCDPDTLGDDTGPAPCFKCPEPYQQGCLVCATKVGEDEPCRAFDPASDCPGTPDLPTCNVHDLVFWNADPPQPRKMLEACWGKDNDIAILCPENGGICHAFRQEDCR